MHTHTSFFYLNAIDRKRRTSTNSSVGASLALTRSRSANDAFAESVEGVDMSPLYSCLHIYTQLGHRNQFIEKYMKGDLVMVAVVIDFIDELTLESYHIVHHGGLHI